jgi:hypothetical protein
VADRESAVVPQAGNETNGREPSPEGAIDPSVVSALESGFNRLLVLPDDDVDRFDGVLTEILVEDLTACGYADWAQRLRARLQNPPPPMNSAPTDVAKAVGQGLGRFCGSNPIETHLRLTRHVLSAMPECRTEFERAAKTSVRQKVSARGILLSTLRSRASEFANNPRQLVDVHLREVEALKPATIGQLRLQDIWEARPHVPLFIVHDLWAFDLLRSVDLPAYLQLLQELPHVEFTRQIIKVATWTATSDELAQFVRLAPLVLNDVGALVSGMPLAMFALATCIGRWFGGEQYHPLSPRNALVKDDVTFKAESALVLRALAERLDHQPVGYAWLQYLVRSARSRGSRRVGPDGHSSEERWFALIAQLAGALPIHPKPYEWIQSEQSLWRNERIYALLAVLVFHTPIDAGGIAELLKICLTKGIVTTHAIQELQFKEQRCNFGIVGLAVSSINDLAGWFKTLWAAIYLQRERTRRNRRDPNDDLQNVGLVAVFWALAGLAQLPADSPVRRSLWVELEVAVRESALTDAFRTAGDAWCVAAHYLAAYWTQLFTDDPALGVLGSLDDFLLNWAEADGDFASLVAELASHGVTPEQFSRSLQGDLVRAALDDARYLHQRTRKPLPVFDLEGLADAIDAHRSPC